jgi:hypothetical protein
VQVKRVTGLPPLTDPAALAAVVRESAGRFFLKNGVPLVTSTGRTIGPGTVWAAAFEAPVVRAIERACRTARLRLGAIVPTIVVLDRALTGEHLGWIDGPVCAERTVAEDGRLGWYRRPAVEPSTPLGGTPVAALEALGARAHAFADAYAATCIAREEPLALRPGAIAIGPAPAPSRVRLLLAGGMCLFALVTALVGPGLLATHATHRAAHRLAVLRPAAQQALTTQRELMQVTSALHAVAEFTRTRRSTTFLLRDLAHLLPDGSALTALTVDSTSGTLVALAPHAAHIIDALERVPGLASPEIVGPVTTEMAGARQLERVTIRFRLIGTPTRPSDKQPRRSALPPVTGPAREHDEPVRTPRSGSTVSSHREVHP